MKRTERKQRRARRMWRFYQSHGGHWSFNWPGFAAYKVMERATN